MRKLFNFLGALMKAVFWLAVLLAMTGLIVLFVFDQNIPPPLVTKLSDALSSGDYFCRIGRATYSLTSGAHFYQVRAFPKRVADSALASADEVQVDFSLRPHLALNERLQCITIRNLSIPKPPPKQRAQGGATNTPSPAKAAAGNATFHLPTVSPFSLVLENPNIAGLRAERVSAMIQTDASHVSVSQVAIRWPDKNFTMDVNGFVTADFDTRMLHGSAKGQAFPSDILPLLQTLHAKGAIKQVDCFSKLERPVNADAAFDVNLDNSDFSLILGLDVGPCTYRDVPMKYAKGTLSAYGTNIYTTVVIDPLQAESMNGPIAGRLVYREDTESLEINATSAMTLQETAAIINILNHGELNPIRCATPFRLSAQGIVAIDSKKSTVKNALTGKLAFDEGSVLHVGVKDVTCDLKLTGYSASFNNVHATSLSGGKIAGGIIFDFPNYSATSTLFTASATLANMTFSDFSELLKVTDARAGNLSINLALLGRPCDHTISTLAGEGNMAIRNSIISRMPLFAGFTEQAAQHVPGISSLVNQSTGSLDFTIDKGVLHTDNLLIEGDVFSMSGHGTCDLDTEKLDFVMRTNIFKKKSIVGRITHLVTAPLSSLLLEFKVFGTLSKSDWSYVNLIEKIANNIPGLSGSSKSEAEKPVPAPTETPAPAP